ncbi:Tryptophan/tyrosine permease family [Seminavis robusta]|uniref:Tryptophan/tyrosine permease family n=1 Tax=Seminavis robusta TaxID=568900 RepID=A0A9N8D4X2_9STRA|nr:Tryptophan/tyrosine permease family [Seminavis robusta]|eukprot:Sro5_g004470.1 Tryptophan/tyrosine permease family (551) ;mRNA; r:160373-162025
MSARMRMGKSTAVLAFVLVATAVQVVEGFSSSSPSSIKRISSSLDALPKKGADLSQSDLHFAVETSEGRRRPDDSALSAVAVSGGSGSSAQQIVLVDADEDFKMESLSLPGTTAQKAIDFKSLQSTLTAALLITGNTVGAGALALPELAARPGLAPSTGMFVTAYVINLLSGLILAEVAIKQFEETTSNDTGNDNQEEDLPSSFREFAASTMEDSFPLATNGIAGVSLFVNTCALTYSLGVAGVIFSDCLAGASIDANHLVLSAIFAALLAVMGATQSRTRISQVSSVFVTGLFVSLAGLLLPGLPNVQDPMGTFLAPGTSTDGLVAGMGEAAPIMLTTLIFQNVVPPVAKILEYDRVKTVSAVMIGSFLPLAIYLAWSFAVLGGGVDAAVGNVESPLTTLFSVTAVTGSAIGCTMAISEELQAFVDDMISNDDDDDDGDGGKDKQTSQDDNNSGYSWPAVVAAVVVPLGCSTLCNEYADALKLSGGYGIPVLYGAIPVAMALTQRQKLQSHANLVPGGMASLGLVGLAFGAFLVNSIVTDLSHVVSATA